MCAGGKHGVVRCEKTSGGMIESERTPPGCPVEVVEGDNYCGEKEVAIQAL